MIQDYFSCYKIRILTNTILYLLLLPIKKAPLDIKSCRNQED